MSEARKKELREVFDSHQPWLHMMEVEGVPTKLKPAWGEPLDNPRQKWAQIKPELDVAGKRVLDVGCNDGHYMYACRDLGASQCVGIEASYHHYKNAVLMRDLLGEDNVRIENKSAYQIDSSLGQFDVTLLLGLIYHLKNPLLVIDAVAEITSEMIVLETALRNSSMDVENRKRGVPSAPAMDYVENPYRPTTDTAHIGGGAGNKVRYEGVPNWWLPNIECVCAMLRGAGFSRTKVVSENIFESSEKKGHFGRGLVIGYK